MANSAWPSPGWNWTAEYQTSGIPFVTSSFGVDTNVRRVDFDFVTRDITIDNSGTSPLRVGFSRNGVNGVGGDNYFLVRPNTTVTFEVRVKEVYFRADSGTTGYSVLAGCTTIPAKQMPHLSGSISGSLNWRGV
jgi:hypothetical protein